MFGELRGRRKDLAGGLKKAGLTTDDVIARWFGGPARVASLRALLARLRRARVAVYICSFSFSPIIRELLALAGLDFDAYFKAPLLGRKEMQRRGKKGNDPTSKQVALAALLGPGGQFAPDGLAASEVLFVDDSQRNLDAVDVATGFLVRPVGGVDVARLEAALFG